MAGAAFAIGALSSCDEGSGSYPSGIGPAPHIIGSTFDLYRNADGTVTNVPLQPLIVLRFDRLMSSKSVYGANFSFSSGAATANIGYSARVDPVERTIVLTLLETPAAPPQFPTPQPAFAPGTQYQLHVFSSSSNLSQALSAYDGALFEGETIFTFETEGARAPGEVDQTVSDPVIDPGSDDPCYALDVLEYTCTGSLCHGSPTGPYTAPAEGLDFSSSAAIQGTAISRPSTLVQEQSGGPQGYEPGHFPYGMSIVDPGTSSESFLMYKVLAHPLPDGAHAAFGGGSPFDVPGADDANLATVDDLAARMPGSAMPNVARGTDPSQGAASIVPGLSWGDLRALRYWIDHGATTPSDASCAAGAIRRRARRR